MTINDSEADKDAKSVSDLEGASPNHLKDSNSQSFSMKDVQLEDGGTNEDKASNSDT